MSGPGVPPTSYVFSSTEQTTEDFCKRDPKCWNCKHDKKSCTIEMNASMQSTCQRCLGFHRECSNEKPREPTKMRNKLKCSECRRRKQACSFPNGSWPKKCSECEDHNLDCAKPTTLPGARKLATIPFKPATDVPTTPSPSAVGPLQETPTSRLPSPRQPPLTEHYTGSSPNVSMATVPYGTEVVKRSVSKNVTETTSEFRDSALPSSPDPDAVEFFQYINWDLAGESTGYYDTGD